MIFAYVNSACSLRNGGVKCWWYAVPWRHEIDRPRTVNRDVTHSQFGCFYAPADFYDRREEDASRTRRRRFFMVTMDLQGAAFSISRMCISTLPFGPRVVYMSRRLSLSRWPFRRLLARWRYGVEAVGKFVRRRSLCFSWYGPPLDFDGHVLRITTAPLLHYSLKSQLLFSRPSPCIQIINLSRFSLFFSKVLRSL